MQLKSTLMLLPVYGGYAHRSWVNNTYMGVARTGEGVVLQECPHTHATPHEAMLCADAILTSWGAQAR